MCGFDVRCFVSSDTRGLFFAELNRLTWFTDHEDGDGFCPRLNERASADMEAPGSKLWCKGDIGRDAYCYMAGVLILTTDVSIVECDETDIVNAQFVSDVLEKNGEGTLEDGVPAAPWKFCTWHKNQVELQGGNKGDGTGWQIFDTCADYGAVVVNGHEHSYTRTATLKTPLENLECLGDCADSLEVSQVGPGQVPVIVSGLGGGGVRDVIKRPHMVAAGGDSEASPVPEDVVDVELGGALFCSFFVDGDPNKASCVFMSTSGETVDSFVLMNDPTGTSPAKDTLTPTDPSTGLYTTVTVFSYLAIVTTLAAIGLFVYRKTPYYESMYMKPKEDAPGTALVE